MNKYKKLGIIGGLGPLASVYFYEMLTKMQAVRHEQEYIDILLYSKPSTPDRTAYINGQSDENPEASLLDAGLTLQSAGAELIVIPCVTAHFFYDRLAEGLQVPLLHMVEGTAAHIARLGVKRAGLLATDGTLNSRIFHKALSNHGIETIIPSCDDQAALMRLIYEHVKMDRPADTTFFKYVCEGLHEQGAETIILGCTELSMVKRDLCLGQALHITDAMAVLARTALTCCGAEIKTMDGE